MFLVVHDVPVVLVVHAGHDWKAENKVHPMSLDVSAIPVWCQSTGGCLESCWASVDTGIPKRWFLKSAKERHSNRRDELASKNEIEQAKTSFLLLHPLMWVATRKCVQHLRWVSLLQIIWPRKSLPGVSSSLGFNSRWSQVDNEDWLSQFPRPYAFSVPPHGW